jgi:hypothetical protein
VSSETTPSQAERPLPAGRPRRRRRVGPASLVIVLAVALGLWAANQGAPAQTAAVSPAASGPGTGVAAPSGAYTLLDGTQANLSALRGQPTMVWFVADGCASCAVSIPAVAQHLGAFTRTGTRVVVLGIYGAFGQGSQGTAALAGFGKAAAGPSFKSPAWTWGLASQRLTTAYDPSGVPDAYYLLDAKGHIAYQNSVPVSTMGALLAHLDSVTGRPVPSSATQQAADAPMPLLP